MNFVAVEQIQKSFGQQTVLDRVSLQLKKGEFATLLGQSGCGKSTLLRAIAGLVDVDGGRIFIDGREITHEEPRKRKGGMVFQSYALFPNMTVEENIAFGLKMKKDRDAESKVRRMIELVHLNGKEKAYPHQLSGGQQQRVALARSLVVEPKVLLLDEPLGALDAKIRHNLQNELKRIQRELMMTTVFVTHDREEAMRLSDTVHIMHEGRIVQSGAPQDVYASPRNAFVAEFFGNYNVMSAEQFARMAGGEVPSASQVAIRPEVVCMEPSEAEPQPPGDAWSFRGKVCDITMMGNVLRYEVTTDGPNLLVDQLHRNQAMLPPGTPVRLSVARSELILYP